jgi:hypothetical protein
LSAFQWQPVLSTNKSAFIASRSGTRGLWQPNGWAGRGGNRAPSPESRIGFSGGYRYNSVLGEGYSWGLQAEADVGRHTTLLLSVSGTFFPDGASRAREALGDPDGSMEYPWGVRWAGGAEVGVRFPMI